MRAVERMEAGVYLTYSWIRVSAGLLVVLTVQCNCVSGVSRSFIVSRRR